MVFVPRRSAVAAPVCDAQRSWATAPRTPTRELVYTGIKKAGPRGGTHRFLGFRRRRRGPHAPFLRGVAGPKTGSDDVARPLALSSCAGATLGAARAAPTARWLPDRARTRVALVAHFIRKRKCVVRCPEAIFSSDRCAIAVCRSCRLRPRSLRWVTMRVCMDLFLTASPDSL